MRMMIAAAALLAGCSAGAQPMCVYDFYIFELRGGGAQIYAIAGSGRAVAVEVRGCEARSLEGAQDFVSDLRRQLSQDEIDAVTVESRGSRTYLGSCVADDHDAGPRQSDDEDSLVHIRRATAAQTRRLVEQIDAAPHDMRQEMISALGLRGCMGQSSARR
jgi:hypothetical protein